MNDLDVAGIPGAQGFVQLPIEEKRVGFGKRFGALLLDGIISMIVPLGAYFLLGTALDGFIDSSLEATGALEDLSQPGVPDFAVSMSRFGVAMGVLGGGFGLLYGLIEVFTGSTPGKMILGMVAANADGTRGNVALWAKRWLIKSAGTILSFIAAITFIQPLSWVGSLLSFGFLVGCFFALGNSKQALHDLIAGTAVFHKEDVA